MWSLELIAAIRKIKNYWSRLGQGTLPGVHPSSLADGHLNQPQARMVGTSDRVTVYSSWHESREG